MNNLNLFRNVSLISAVEQIFKSFEEKLDALNERVALQHTTIIELTKRKSEMATKESQTKSSSSSSEMETQTERQPEPLTRLRVRTYSSPDWNGGQKRGPVDQSAYYQNNKIPKYLNQSLSMSNKRFVVCCEISNECLNRIVKGYNRNSNA